MRTIALDPSGFPDGTELEQQECHECGVTGHVPAYSFAPPTHCMECTREQFRAGLDRSADTWMGRTEALKRLAGFDQLLPIADPEANDDETSYITEIETDQGPKGRYVKRITHVLERECPECGYDRAERTDHHHFTFEHSMVVRCRLCETVIEEHATY